MKNALVLAFCVALNVVSSPLSQAVAQALPIRPGTWFGTFVLTNAEGRVSHDHAVLIVNAKGASLDGSMGRTIDQMTPWTGGVSNGGHLTFHLNAAGGLQIRLTAMPGDRLEGSASGQGVRAEIELMPSPGLLPHQQLQEEIMLADHSLYEAFGGCHLVEYAAFLSADLEFYQDHTGRTGYAENVKALQDRCAEGIQLRRELTPDTLVVNAAPGFGAIEAGVHRFYSRNEEGKEHLDATARFTNIWSKESGTWKLVRVISYDHQ